MKTLKSKIQIPFFILSVLVPLATLIIFNISIKFYINSNIKNMMKTSMSILENTHIAEFLIDIPESSADFDNLLKLLVNVNILVYEDQLKPYCLNNSSDNFVNDAIVEEITEKLPFMQKSKIYYIRVHSKKFYIASYPLESSQSTIVYIAQTNTTNKLIEITNIFLLIIMFNGVLIASYISNIISNRIVKKVKNLCTITEQIGRGEFLIIHGPASDILEINQLHQSIIQMSMQLDASDRTQKTFLQNASHELRTPLMSIQGYAEGIENGILTDTKSAARIINSESIRLNKLVSELLTLSRIESRSYSKELIPINLCNILKEYMQRLGGFASKENVSFLLTLPDTPVYTLADDELLSQAVLNIASNCMRHAKNTVQITLIQKEKKAIIRIIDDGDGIVAEDLPHIFERFYKGKNGNSGLGLSIAQKAIEFLDGNITVQSTRSGSIFEITLNTIDSLAKH